MSQSRGDTKAMSDQQALPWVRESTVSVLSVLLMAYIAHEGGSKTFAAAMGLAPLAVALAIEQIMRIKGPDAVPGSLRDLLWATQAGSTRFVTSGKDLKTRSTTCEGQRPMHCGAWTDGAPGRTPHSAHETKRAIPRVRVCHVFE